MLILLVVGATYAYFNWTSTSENKDVTLSVNSVSGDGVCEKITDNNMVLKPVSNRNNGRIATINTKQRISKYASVTWNLEITSINEDSLLTSGLKNASFKYELINTTSGDVYGRGDFSGVNEGDIITLSSGSDTLLYDTNYTFTFYLWIDGKMANASDMINQPYSFNLTCNMVGTPDNANLIHRMKHVESSSATTSFWGSSINANQVKSISFITDVSQIPQSGTYDVSLNNNNTVKMWYVANGTTTDGTISLYDVYVADTDGYSSIKLDTSAVKMFGYLSNCEAINNLTMLDTSSVTSMLGMFCNCPKLTTVNLTNFDTSNVTNFSGLFYGCYVLNNIDLSSFETFNVTTMYYMFCDCKALSSINLSNFDTSNVTNMTYMFTNCLNLTTLDLDSFNTSGVTDMSFMFCYCSNLTSVDLSSFDISNVKTFVAMFQNCSSLTSLDLSNFGVSTASNYSYMFCRCQALEKLDLSNLVTNGAQNMEAMFSGCEALTVLDINSFNTSNVTNMKYMFNACGLLHTIYVGNSWSTASVTNSSNMFSGDTSLVGGNGTVYNSNYTDMTYGRIDTATTPGYLTYKA